MNKKVLAVGLLLMVLVGGVYAVTLPVTDTATLTASIGEYLYHGFFETETPDVYSATKEIGDAFTTDPVFNYGYNTNIDPAVEPIEFTMSVTDFILDTNSDVQIKIGDVLFGTETPTPVAGVYTLFNTATDGASGSVQVTIQPLKASGTDHVGLDITTDSIIDTLQYVNVDAASGTYTSTVTIYVSAAS